MPDAQVPEVRRFAGNATQHWVLDTDRIRRELGFDPPITLEEAVRRTIEWDRANPPQTRPSVADYEAEDRALTQVLSSES